MRYWSSPENIVLDNSIELCTDNEVKWLVVFLEGEIETSVLVSFRCERFGLFGRIIEWVGVRKLKFGVL